MNQDQELELLNQEWRLQERPAPGLESIHPGMEEPERERVLDVILRILKGEA